MIKPNPLKDGDGKQRVSSKKVVSNPHLVLEVSRLLNERSMDMKLRIRAVSLCLSVLFLCLIACLGIASGQGPVKKPVATPSTKSRDIQVVIIVDNYPYKEGVDTEHGFSCLVTGTEKTILFDTGPSDRTLLNNMKKLEIKPEEVQLVVLSHEHFDHTRGLQGFLEKNHNVTVYLLESFQKAFEEQVTASGAKVVKVRDSLEICDGVYSIVVGDEQALLIHSDKGGVLIAGCAHPGIVNMIRKAKEVTKGDILAAMGGFHLQGNFGEVSTSEIETTVSSFKDLGVRYVGATHCSGNEARRLFKENYKEHYLDLGTGKVLMVKELK